MEKVRTYSVISLDVWGNEEGGFVVNQPYATGLTVDIADAASDEAIVDALKGIDYLHPDLKDAYVDGECEESLCVYRDDGYPLCEIRRIEGEDYVSN